MKSATKENKAKIFEEINEMHGELQDDMLEMTIRLMNIRKYLWT